LVHILIADRERLFAEALEAALEAPGLRILEDHPATGLGAVKAAIAHKPDVVLLDYWLEGMRGPAAARVILKRFPQTRVILTSWFYTQREVQEAAQSGARAFVPKSFEVSQVVLAIQTKEPENAEPQPGARRGTGKPAGEGQRLWDSLLSLTVREMEVLGMLSAYSAEQIAQTLAVSLGTVRNHIHNILNKTGARTQLEAVDLARSCGLV